MYFTVTDCTCIFWSFSFVRKKTHKEKHITSIMVKSLERIMKNIQSQFTCFSVQASPDGCSWTPAVCQSTSLEASLSRAEYSLLVSVQVWREKNLLLFCLWDKHQPTKRENMNTRDSNPEGSLPFWPCYCCIQSHVLKKVSLKKKKNQCYAYFHSNFTTWTMWMCWLCWCHMTWYKLVEYTPEG